MIDSEERSDYAENGWIRGIQRTRMQKIRSNDRCRKDNLIIGSDQWITLGPLMNSGLVKIHLLDHHSESNSSVGLAYVMTWTKIDRRKSSLDVILTHLNFPENNQQDHSCLLFFIASINNFFSRSLCSQILYPNTRIVFTWLLELC